MRGGIETRGRSIPARNIRRSSRDELADLYARHLPKAMRLAYFLTGDREAAEDLAQEAFVRVATRLRGAGAPASFEGYLRSAVVNLHRSKLRRLKLERDWLARERPRTDQAAGGEPIVHDELWRALLALPPRQRAAVVLRYYEDLSERETAELLGCSPGAAGQLVVRAMAFLRDRLDEAGEHV